MLGNFSYKNATKLYFGDDSLKYLNGCGRNAESHYRETS